VKKCGFCRCQEGALPRPDGQTGGLGATKRHARDHLEGTARYTSSEKTFSRGEKEWTPRPFEARSRPTCDLTLSEHNRRPQWGRPHLSSRRRKVRTEQPNRTNRPLRPCRAAGEPRRGDSFPYAGWTGGGSYPPPLVSRPISRGGGVGAPRGGVHHLLSNPVQQRRNAHSRFLRKKTVLGLAVWGGARKSDALASAPGKTSPGKRRKKAAERGRGKTPARKGGGAPTANGLD